MNRFKYFYKLLKLYLTNKFVSLKHISQLFNRLNKTSEIENLKNISISSIPMLDEIIRKLESNQCTNINILEIGCGLGFSSNYLYSKLCYGNYTLVDISKNMLIKAEKHCNFKGNFVESDMLSYLKNCADNSLDVIICSYAISYSSPKEIISQCSRVLKSNGYLGVIDNIKGNFPELKSVCSKFFIKNSNLINKLPLKLKLPINEYFFEKNFVDNRFNRINLKSDSNTVIFNSKASLYAFISTPGILSTLSMSFNLEDSDVKSSLLNLLEDNNINSLTHKYIWGTFRNDK